MRVSITEHRLRYGQAGPIQARLYAGLRHVADLDFVDQPAPRVTVDPETRFITLRFEDALRAEVLGLLRTWPRVTIDTESGELLFEG
ncbi:MAG: hypothetical protein KC549_04185 [Myxococcales bacterium]|nr:hypothetical protein [Myxococcales bacterium]